MPEKTNKKLVYFASGSSGNKKSWKIFQAKKANLPKSALFGSYETKKYVLYSMYGTVYDDIRKR